MSDRVEWVTDEARLGQLTVAWAALVGDDLAAVSDPFMTLSWLLAWRRAFGSHASLAVALAWRGERLVGAIPLQRTAGGLVAMANEHTPSFRPLAVDAAALATITAAALDAAGGVLRLPMLAGDHPLARGHAGAWRSLTSPHTVSPVIDLTDGFDAWRALTRPRWRTPIERLARKMRRDHDAVVTLVQAPEDLDTVLDAGLAVEAAGWKGREGTAIASSPATTRFYREVAAAFEATGQLRVSSIALDGQLVAFALCLLHGNRLWQLKIAFDEEYKRLAPGLVMHVEAVERCFELGLTAYELLGDRSEWKDKFATSHRTYESWTGYARRPLPIGHYLARRGGRVARQLRRREPPGA